MSANGDSYYVCHACEWVQETKERAEWCHRCLASPVQSITVTEFIALLDAGEVSFCKTCKIVHTT
jgi:Zn-finger protein